MSAGDGHILDRLYPDENATIAMEYLWSHMHVLRDDIACAAGAASCVAFHAVKRFANPAEGYQMTAEDASFLALAHEVCAAENIDVGDEIEGINPLIWQALLTIARRLIEEWLSEE